MTKEKAFNILVNYFLNGGIVPAIDCVIHTEKDGQFTSQWTYKGLKELLIK